MSDTPKLIENRVDLKGFTVNALNAVVQALNANEFTDVTVKEEVSLYFLTNLGLIEANIVTVPKKDDVKKLTEDNFISFLIDNMIDARNKVISDLEEKQDNLQLVNGSSFIYLKKAKITQANSPGYTLDELILFTDQIIGITFGKKS